MTDCFGADCYLTNDRENVDDFFVGLLSDDSFFPTPTPNPTPGPADGLFPTSSPTEAWDDLWATEPTSSPWENPWDFGWDLYPDDDWRPTDPPTIDYYGDSESESSLNAGPIVFLLALFVIISYIFQKGKFRREGGNNINVTATPAAREIAMGTDDLPGDSPTENSPATMVSRIFKMSSVERVVLYSEAFERNQNQTILNDASVLPTSTRHYQTPDSNDVDEADSICELMQNAPSLRHFSEDSFLSPQQPKEKSTILHPRGGKCRETNGNCVICLEKLRPGETVVWSETESCPHVYHKDCLVGFFAQRQMTKVQIEEDKNPCPICRQQYVTVCTPAAMDAFGTMR